MGILLNMSRKLFTSERNIATCLYWKQSNGSLALRERHWLSVKMLIDFKVLLLTDKVLNMGNFQVTYRHFVHCQDYEQFARWALHTSRFCKSKQNHLWATGYLFLIMTPKLWNAYTANDQFILVTCDRSLVTFTLGSLTKTGSSFCRNGLPSETKIAGY